MIEVTAYDKAVARAAARALGGEPRVIEYRGDDDREPIAVLQSADRPTPGFVAYSTVSLHRAPNLVGERDIRVELLGVAPAGKAEFGNLLAGAAGLVAEYGFTAALGGVLPGVFADYDLSDTLEHLVLCPPFAYEQLGAVELDDGPSVHWLQAVPISESERRFHLAHGFDALEARFTEAEMEYWDLDRAPLA
jgi:hypothetical protein